MPTTINARINRRFQCRHVFTDGHRCGSPCLTGEDFCFYHHTTRGRAAIPTRDLSQGEHQAAPFNLPVPELGDRSGIQFAIAEILNRLAANQLDPRRAGLMLYGLQIASANLPRSTSSADPVEEIVTDPTLGLVAPRSEVPDAPSVEDATPSLARLLLRELERTRSEHSADPAILPDLHATARSCYPQSTCRNIPSSSRS